MSRQRGDVHESGLGPLFNPPARHLVGRTDPPTSRRAAAAVAGSPRLTNWQRLTLAVISAQSAGVTVPEMAEWLVKHGQGETGPLAAHGVQRGLDHEFYRQLCGRRVNELEKAGLIRRGGRLDGCTVWFLVERS